MKITQFAKKITRIEVGERQVDIAQTMEILNRINRLTKGAFYAIVKLMPERCK